MTPKILLHWITFSIWLCSVQGISKEETLITLFSNITNLPSWFNSSNNSCNWSPTNIECGNSDKITKIILNNHNLSGTLTWNVLLPNLNTFDIRNNNIYGYYDLSFFPPTTIKFILLSNNKFKLNSYTFDSESQNIGGPSTFDVLRRLDLSNNELTGTININASDFPQLIVLDISNNPIKYMTDLSSLPTTLLSLGAAGINWDSNNLDLSNFTQLQQVDLSNNYLSGTINFKTLPNTLFDLELSNNNFIGTLQLTSNAFNAPNIQLIDLSNNSLTNFNISGWKESFLQLKELNLLNNPLINAIEYIPISDVPINDKNITFLIDITFPCDPQIYCPAVINGSNTSFIACDRSENICFGEQDCITTCVCCNQIPTTTQVITTQFITTNIDITNIVLRLSDAITYWLLYKNNSEIIEQWKEKLYTRAVYTTDLIIEGDYNVFKQDLMEVYIAKCNINDMDKCNDIFLDIKWPKNGIVNDLYYFDGISYVQMDVSDNDLITVIMAEYIAVNENSNINMISILQEDESNNNGYIELKLILNSENKVLFNINLNNINWDEISNKDFIKLPLCLSRDNFLNSKWNFNGCKVYNYDTNLLLCGCSHLTFFKAESDEFKPEINILSEYHFKQVTFINIFKYPTGIICIFILLIIYLLLIKFLSESDSKPLLAIPDIVWRNKKIELVENNGYTKIIRLSQMNNMSQWNKTYAITIIAIKDSHSLIRIFKHTKHTNTSTLQCITCLFLYISCVLASGALFYGQGKTTILGEISLSFYCGFTACIPSYFIIFLFLLSRPKERKPKFTQEIFNKIISNNSKTTTDGESLEYIGQRFLTVCEKLKEISDDNDDEKEKEIDIEGDNNDETTAIISNINISEINSKSLNNLINVTLSILQSEKIRKALLKKTYPCPNYCKIIAWILTIIIILISSILIIVYGINFDLITQNKYDVMGNNNYNNNTYICNDIMNNNNNCSNVTISIMKEYIYDRNEYSNWGEHVSNTSSFFWSMILGLFLGWILYQPLSILLFSWLRFIIIPSLTIENIIKKFNKCFCCKKINNEYDNVNQIIIVAELELQNIKKIGNKYNNNEEEEDNEILKDMGVIKTYDNGDNDNNNNNIKTTFDNFIINDNQYTVDTNLVLKHIKNTFSSLNIDNQTEYHE